MTKSELITKMVSKQLHLPQKDVELAIDSIIEILTITIARRERIEIRGFGVFSTSQYQARIARNPKTGEAVNVPSRTRLHFKPGLDLQGKVNASRALYKTIKDGSSYQNTNFSSNN